MISCAAPVHGLDGSTRDTLGEGSNTRAGPLQVSDDEYTKLLHDGIQPVASIDSNFANFTYTPRSLPEDDTSMVSFPLPAKRQRVSRQRFKLNVHRNFLARQSHQGSLQSPLEMEWACGLPAWAAGPAQGPGAGWMIGRDCSRLWPQSWHLTPCVSKILGEFGSKSS